MEDRKVNDLLGKTLASIVVSEDKEKLLLTTLDHERYVFLHEPDCCESVYLDDIAGDLDDVIGSPIVQSEVVSEENTNPKPEGAGDDETWTWTFTKLATRKGSVTLRWVGISNGYYSENVDLFQLDQSEELYS